MKQKIFINSLLFIIISIIISIIICIINNYNKESNLSFINDFFFTEPIDEYDIKIYKEEILYNIGDLLCIPKLYGFSEWVNIKQHNMYNEAVEYHKNSILAYYEELRSSPNESIPNFNTLRKAVDVYIEKNYYNTNFTKLLGFVQNKDVLCVHLRIGDVGEIEDKFKEIIYNLQMKYKYIVIFCGVHYKDSGVYSQFIDSVNSLIESEINIKYRNILISIEDPDIHLAMFRKCNNLLVHKGGFTAIATTLFTGDKLYMVRDIFSGESILSNEISKKTRKFNELIIL